jgi:hypothetical protein
MQVAVNRFFLEKIIYIVKLIGEMTTAPIGVPKNFIPLPWGNPLVSPSSSN